MVDRKEQERRAEKIASDLLGASVSCTSDDYSGPTTLYLRFGERVDLTFAQLQALSEAFQTKLIDLSWAEDEGWLSEVTRGDSGHFYVRIRGWTYL